LYTPDSGRFIDETEGSLSEMAKTDLTDELVVVTGGTRGIGYHTAAAFLEAGARVAITGREAERAAEAAQQLGERCAGYGCDQRDRGQVDRFAGQLLDEHGAPAVLVANAGIMRGGGPVPQLDPDNWDAVIGTNLTGTFLMCRALLPAMIERGRGDVFLISSMSGKKGDPNAAAYAASKFGLQGFAQAMNHDVRRHNVRVMVLNPSAVNTEYPDQSPPHGPGQTLHGADLATLMVDLAQLPGRTLVRDADIWGTNPF
jgi:3-oxoacyl-[acyl-carrier protein] reductase